MLVNRNVVFAIIAVRPFWQCLQKEPFSNQSNPKSPM